MKDVGVLHDLDLQKVGQRPCLAVVAEKQVPLGRQAARELEAPQPIGREETTGLRWDFTTWRAIKLEYGLVLLRDPNSRMHIGTIDWCFGL